VRTALVAQVAATRKCSKDLPALSLSHVQLQVHTSHYIPGAYTTPLWRVQGARGAPAAHGTHAHMSTTHQQRERPTHSNTCRHTLLNPLGRTSGGSLVAWMQRMADRTHLQNRWMTRAAEPWSLFHSVGCWRCELCASPPLFCCCLVAKRKERFKLCFQLSTEQNRTEQANKQTNYCLRRTRLANHTSVLPRH
jgi:hypothetical protein